MSEKLSMEALQRQLREAVQELEEFKRAVRDSASTSKEEAKARKDSISSVIGDLGFVGNWGRREAKKFTRGVAMGVAQDVIATGDPLSVQSWGDQLVNQTLRGFSSVPILGAFTADVHAAKDATQNRISAIATMLARGGGEMSEEQMANLMGIFKPQEERAIRAQRDVAAYFAQAGIVAQFGEEGKYTGPAMQAAVEAGQSLARMFNTLNTRIAALVQILQGLGQ